MPTTDGLERTAGRSSAAATRSNVFAVLCVPTRMEPKRYDTFLRVWVLVAVVVGNALILFGEATLTGIGVVLVVAGLVSLIAVVRNALTPDPA